jgi:transposase
MNVTAIGLDIAKSVFQVHGCDRNGKAVLKKQLRRGQVLAYFANLPASLVGLGACGGAQYWARELNKLGHDARLIRAVGTISDSVIVRMGLLITFLRLRYR